jgi:hypothetical protein
MTSMQKWWIEKSGLSIDELQEFARTIWEEAAH